jgi:membrane protease YdiL (CAAX protease family)
MLALWQRLPVIVRAVLTGLALGAIVTVPWAALAYANFKYAAAVPWAVLPTTVLLWLWWQYVSGKGLPRSTASARRQNLRAFNLSDEVWGAAIIAGILGIATSLLVLNVTSRFVTVPQQPLPPELTQIPLQTLLAINVMGAAVAGIVEEGSFRGYMQGPIERRHGPVVAILVTSTVFGLVHFTHPGLLVLMPFYMTIGVTYGVLAYLTNSILPGLILHATGDAMGGVMALARGRMVSSLPLAPPETGLPFWFTGVALVLVGAATVWALVALASITRQAPQPSALT